MKTHIFTPTGPDGNRLYMQLDANDYAKLSRGPGLKGVVTDQLTDQTWIVEGIPCTFGVACYCDALVTSLPEGSEP